MITVVSLNPCMDETLCGAFQAGATNRFSVGQMDAGGKGYNVAAALKSLGAPVRLIGLMPRQGSDAYMQAVDALGIESDFVSCPGTLRVNTKIVDERGVLTEINRTGFSASALVAAQMADCCRHYAPKSALMLFCGSMPRGFASDFYAAMADQLSAPAMIDASGAALRAAADSKAILLKPNLDEFAQLIGETPAQTLDALACQAGLAAREMGKTLAVSLGARGMLLAQRDQVFYAEAPKVSGVRCSVGAGDNALAAMAFSWTQGGRGETLLSAGVAAGTASVLRAGTQPLCRKTYQELLGRVSPRAIVGSPFDLNK